MSETLSKFSVPDPSGGTSVLLQPKQQHRFRVIATGFGGFSSSIDFTRQINSVSKPSLKFDSKEIHSYNSRAYFIGKHEWGDCSIKARDDITNSMQKLLNTQLQLQINHFTQQAMASAGNYKFQLHIETLDGANGVIDKWFLEGCMLTDVKYGEYDYSKGDAVEIDMTIKFDNATFGPGFSTGVPNALFPNTAGGRGSGFNG